MYHTCFTRNDDGTRVLVDLDKGEECVSGMTEERFWDKKLYDVLKRGRTAEKQKLSAQYLTRSKSKGYISL